MYGVGKLRNIVGGEGQKSSGAGGGGWNMSEAGGGARRETSGLVWSATRALCDAWAIVHYKIKQVRD